MQNVFLKKKKTGITVIWDRAFYLNLEIHIEFQSRKMESLVKVLHRTGFGASTPRMPVSISKLDRKGSLHLTKHWPENNPHWQSSLMYLVKSEKMFCLPQDKSSSRH